VKYICLVYAEPNALSDLSQDEKAALDRDSQAYDEKLVQDGHFLAASALQDVKTARTVRVRRGKPLVTNGPFAETKEVLCGFIFIEAGDPEEALRIAKGIPMARHGTIEVRPELDFG
jgi:hypothetical protein